MIAVDGIRRYCGVAAATLTRMSCRPVEEHHLTNELRHKPGHLVWRAYQLTWLLFAEEAGALDITPVQEALLLVLAGCPGIDQKTLVELVALDRLTARNVIGRLELIAFEPARTSQRRLDGTRMLAVGLDDNFGREITERIEPEAAQIVELAPGMNMSAAADTEFTEH